MQVAAGVGTGFRDIHAAIMREHDELLQYNPGIEKGWPVRK